MGVKNLLPNLRSECPEVFKTLDDSWSHFKDKTIAVDVAIWMYRYWSYDPNFEKNRQKRLSILCQRFWYQYETLRSRGINVIFVFDGVAPVEKADEKERRRLTSEKRLEKKRQETGEEQNIDDIKPTLADYNVLREFMLRMLIPCVRAAGEGEMGCSWLVWMGLADAVLTSDSDALPCGAKCVIFDIPRKETQYVVLDEVLISLRLTLPQFQDVCIMMGTDFNPKIPRLKFTDAIKFVRKYGSLETVLKSVEFAPHFYRLEKAGKASGFTHEATKRIFDVSRASPSLDQNDIVSCFSAMCAHVLDCGIRRSLFKQMSSKRFTFQVPDPSIDRDGMYSVLKAMMPNVDHYPTPISRPFEMVLDETESQSLELCTTLDEFESKSVGAPSVQSASNESSYTPTQKPKRKLDVILDDDEIAILQNASKMLKMLK